MAALSIKFSILDQMSAGMASIASAGEAMASQLDRAAGTADATFEKISQTITLSTSAADSAGTAFDNLQNTINGAAESAETAANSVGEFNGAASEAADQTDYWTSAVSNYDKSALEAIYTTEDLVQMGYKSADALEAQNEMFDLCARSSDELNKAIDASTSIQNDLAETVDKNAASVENLINNEKVSAETKEALTRAAENAQAAMNDLAAAQQNAESALENYNAVMESGTTDLATLESAAEQAGHAAENLAAANEKASTANEELSKTAKQAGDEAEKGGGKGTSAIEDIAGALASAGITDKIKDIATATYEMSTAFSDAESTVVLATGATGDALDGLTQSMMSAYSVSKTGSLDETAAAVGEINTRLGYTDDQLTKTTGLFMDFAAVTGGNASSSVRSVTQLMNRWNVPASEMEQMLSKLTYAGQASGISVDSLSQQLISNKSVLDQLGFSLDEATAMFMNFELSGTNASTVMTGFRKALASGDVSSLEELNDIFGRIQRGAMSAAEASEIFGTRAGPEIVGTVQSGTMSLESFVTALENSSGTLDTTATTAQTLDQKWSQATNNIKAAFTNALEPTVSKISTSLADVANGIGTFLNEHPAVTKAITAIGTGLGVVVTGLAGVALAKTIVIPAIKGIVGSMAAFGPTGWIVLGVTAVVAAVSAFAAMSADSAESVDTLTMATNSQVAEVDRLSSEYENACAQFGEASDQARALKYDLDEATAAVESQQFSVSALYTEIDNLHESTGSLLSACTENTASLDEQHNSALILSAKLKELASTSDSSAAAQAKMEPIVARLNEMYPSLGLNVENVADRLGVLNNQIDQAAKSTGLKARYDSAKANIADLYAQQKKLQEAADKADVAQARAGEAFSNAVGDNLFSAAGALITGASNRTEEAYDEATEKARIAHEDLNAITKQIEEAEAAIEEYGDAASGSSDKVVSAFDAVSIATDETTENISELVTAYNEAYQAAYDSISGQYGLFDEATIWTEDYMTATVENAQAALDSQLAYWEDYNKNLTALTDYGETLTGEAKENFKALMEYASDGSEQAAGLASNMAAAIERGDQETIDKLSETMSKVNEQQETAAQKTADFSTGFTEEMDKIGEKMKSTITDMTMEEDAENAAKATIDAYIAAIKNGALGAQEAAQYVASETAIALGSVKIETSAETASVPGHARGTTNAENLFIAGERGPELIASPAYANGTTNSADFFIAGENGPELIAGYQGSTVFPTEETDRLISALNYRSALPAMPTPKEFAQQETGGQKEQSRHITIEIQGSGLINVDGSTDKETILGMLTEKIKPELMRILQSEMFEEGDGAYDY